MKWLISLLILFVLIPTGCFAEDINPIPIMIPYDKIVADVQLMSGNTSYSALDKYVEMEINGKNNYCEVRALSEDKGWLWRYEINYRDGMITRFSVNEILNYEHPIYPPIQDLSLYADEKDMIEKAIQELSEYLLVYDSDELIEELKSHAYESAKVSNIIGEVIFRCHSNQTLPGFYPSEHIVIS